MSAYTLSCESTVDMPFAAVHARSIPVLFYSYVIDGVAYTDDMLRDPEALPRFYGFLRAGKMPSTSLINEYAYDDFFSEQLEKGDLIHIVFGSGMTASFTNAVQSAEKMQQKYPDRKLIVVDSTCSSSGYGMLVDNCADLRDSGASMEEIEAYVLSHRRRIHHQFFSTDLKFFRRSGRVSGPAALIGTALNLCPLMRLDYDGKIVAYDKVRGKKNAIRATVDAMAAHAENGTQYSGKCFISHSDVPESAEATRQAILERFPNLTDIPIYDIGTIIASHSGPGTVAIYFLGDERPKTTR